MTSFLSSKKQEQGDNFISLGILLNPRSRLNRKQNWFAEAQDLVGHKHIVSTRTIADIPQALKTLLLEQKCTVLGICGGDGTIHHTLNALIQLKALLEKEGEAFSFPPILLLKGGTLNMLAQATKHRETPAKTVRLFLERWKSQTCSSLPIVPLRLLCVDAVDSCSDSGLSRRYGFIFGSELTARCLELYEARFGGGYRGLAQFLQTTVVSFLLNTSFWKKNRYLFEDPPKSVSLRGETSTETSYEFRAVAASTVDIKLLRGLIVGMKVESEQARTFQVRLLLDQKAGQIIRHLPHLVLGQKASGIVDFSDVKECILEGSDYSLDGEVFSIPDGRHMQITSPNWSIPLVAPMAHW